MNQLDDPLPPRTRVLVMTNNYPPHALGGYEIICEEQAAWLQDHGHEVTVLTSRHGLDKADPAEVAGRHGERVLRVLDFHWHDFQHRRPRGPRLWAGERRQRLAVEAVLAEFRPAVTLVWGMACISKSVLQVLDDRDVGMVAVLEENWPTWDIAADHWIKLWSPRAPLVVRGLRFPWRRAAARVAPLTVEQALKSTVPIYVSPQLRDEIEPAVPAWQGRGRVVPNGIRFDLFARGRDDDGKPLGNPLKLIYAGRVERRKGVHTAIQALSELDQLGVAGRLDIVGWQNPAYVAELRALAERLKVADRVTLRGPVPRDRLADEYSGADVLVFPTTWSEPFGLVPLEAMAAGCVVVGTGTGGSAEHLRHGETALLFPPGQPRALAAQVQRLLVEPGLAASLRRGGRAEARARDHRVQMRRLDEAIAQVLRDR